MNTGTSVTGTLANSSDTSTGSSQVMTPESNTSMTNSGMSINTMSPGVDSSMEMTESESSQS